MPDVAELGVRVTLDGAQAAATGLDNLTASADKAEASTQRATSAFSATEQAVMKMGAEVQEAYRYWQQGEASLDDERLLRRVGVIGATTDALYKQAAAERAETEAAVQALSAQAQVSEIYTANRSIVLQHMQALETDASAYRYSESVIAAHVEALQLDAIANTEAAAAANGHAISLGRVNMELGTATGRILGLNPAMTRFGAMLGGSLGGYLPMIALTVAIVAAGEAWKHFTEEARKAQEQQDKNTESLKKWYEEQANGGKRAQEVAAAQNDLIDKQKKLADLQSQQGVTDFSSTRNLQRANDLKQQIATLRAAIAEDQRMIAAGAGDVQKTQSEAFDQQMQRHSQALAEELKFHQDDANLRKQALAQLQQDQALEAQFRKAGLIERAADYAGMVKGLSDAIDPKVHLSTSGASAQAKNEVVTGLQKQLVEMRKVNEEENVANVQRKYEIELVGMVGYARDLLVAKEKAEVDTLKARHDLSGIALEEALQMIQADEDASIAKAKLVRTLKEEADTRTMLNDIVKDVTRIGKENERAANASVTASANGVKAQFKEMQQVADNAFRGMQADLAQFFDDAFTKGVASFTSLFTQIKNLFFKLIAEMAAADIMKSAIGKGIAAIVGGIFGAPSPAAAQSTGGSAIPDGAFGMGGSSAMATAGAGLGIGMAGFGVGSMIGSHASSALTATLGGAAGGAATGAAIGMMGGPIGVAAGAFIGGVAGAVGGLLGFTHSASQAADAARKLQLGQDSVASSLAQWREQITGTAADQKAAALMQLRVQYEQMVQTIEQTEAGKKQADQRNKDLDEAAKLYQQQKTALENNTAAMLQNTGMLNEVQGYKLAEQTYNYAPPTPIPAPPGNGSGNSGGSGSSGGTQTDGGRDNASLNITPAPVALTLDGKVIARGVVKFLQDESQRQFGTTDRWAEVVM